MKLSRFVEKDWVCCNRTAGNRTEALEELLNCLPKRIGNDAANQLLDDDSSPDSAFTVGNGVAFPHARTSAIDKIKVAVGLFPDGVPYEENAGKDVQLIVLFLFDEKRSGLYLKVLSAFSELLERDVHVDNLARSSSPDSLMSYLEATGSRILGTFSLHDLVLPPAGLLRTTDTVEDALHLLTEHPDEPLPVLDSEGVLVGEISHPDLIGLSVQDFFGGIPMNHQKEFTDVLSDFLTLHGDTPVVDVMSGDPFSLDDSCTLFEATYKLVDASRTHAFVTAEDHLVGIFRLSNWIDKIARLNA